MKKAALALLVIVSGCVLIGQHRYTSMDDIGWQDYAPFAAADRNERIIARYPFLRAAPSYRLRLNISNDLNRIQGSEEVRFTNETEAPVDSLDFVLLPNTLPNTLAVTSAAANGVDLPVTLSNDGLVLHMTFPRPISPGEVTLVEIGYTIEARQSTKVGFNGLNDGLLTLGYAYPMIPASGKWSYGRPSPQGDLTANPASFYLIEVTYPVGLRLVAPGRVLHRSEHSGTETMLIAMGPARDLFLQLGKLDESTSRTVGGIELRVEASPEDRVEAGRILDAADYALRLYSRLFGAYPYRNLTFTVTKFDAYGLEFPGIILLTSRLFGNLEDRVDGIPRRILLESTVAHEVAHQWFYGLIGTDQLAEPWIDEGLAQYATYRYYLARYGAAGAQGFMRSIEGRVARGGDPTLRIGGPVDSYTPKGYSSAIYGRAPLFFVALSERLGAEKFDEFLMKLSARYRWRTVTGKELKTMAEEGCGCRLDDMWAEWVEPFSGAGARSLNANRLPL